MIIVTRLIGLIMIIFLISACGSSTHISKNVDEALIVNKTKFNIGNIQCQINDVPEHFLSALKGYLITELKKRNIYTEDITDKPCSINISVNYYRMRTGFTRMMFGVFAGKDGVESTVSIFDPKTNNIRGESNVSSFNMMAIGEMDDIAKMHAEEIAEFVAGELKN